MHLRSSVSQHSYGRQQASQSLSHIPVSHPTAFIHGSLDIGHFSTSSGYPQPRHFRVPPASLCMQTPARTRIARIACAVRAGMRGGDGRADLYPGAKTMRFKEKKVAYCSLGDVAPMDSGGRFQCPLLAAVVFQFQMHLARPRLRC